MTRQTRWWSRRRSWCSCRSPCVHALRHRSALARHLHARPEPALRLLVARRIRAVGGGPARLEPPVRECPGGVGAQVVTEPEMTGPERAAVLDHEELERDGP